MKTPDFDPDRMVKGRYEEKVFLGYWDKNKSEAIRKINRREWKILKAAIAVLNDFYLFLS